MSASLPGTSVWVWEPQSVGRRLDVAGVGLVARCRRSGCPPSRWSPLRSRRCRTPARCGCVDRQEQQVPGHGDVVLPPGQTTRRDRLRLGRVADVGTREALVSCRRKRDRPGRPDRCPRTGAPSSGAESGTLATSRTLGLWLDAVRRGGGRPGRGAPGEAVEPSGAAEGDPRAPAHPAGQDRAPPGVTRSAPIRHSRPRCPPCWIECWECAPVWKLCRTGRRTCADFRNGCAGIRIRVRPRRLHRRPGHRGPGHPARRGHRSPGDRPGRPGRRRAHGARRASASAAASHGRPAADVLFTERMIPHHRQALEMAALVRPVARVGPRIEARSASASPPRSAAGDRGDGAWLRRARPRRAVRPPCSLRLDGRSGRRAERR